MDKASGEEPGTSTAASRKSAHRKSKFLRSKSGDNGLFDSVILSYSSEPDKTALPAPGSRAAAFSQVFSVHDFAVLLEHFNFFYIFYQALLLSLG